MENGFEWLNAVREQYKYHELTDKQNNKLKGDCRPGSRIMIFWDKDIIDIGYVFVAPGMDADLADCFVHVPNPQNPGGIGNTEEQFAYMITLMQNPFVKKLNCNP